MPTRGAEKPTWANSVPRAPISLTGQFRACIASPMIHALMTLLMMWLPTGPACCDDIQDITSCSPFDFLADVGGVCSRSTIDAEIAWCDRVLEQCFPTWAHTGHWRCCDELDGCDTPLGETLVIGETIIVCEADSHAVYCDPWEYKGGNAWECTGA